MNTRRTPSVVRRLPSGVFVLAMVLGGGLLPATASHAAEHKPLTIDKIDRSTPVDFEAEILPALNTSCLACHNKTKSKAGLVLETPADILKGGDNGPAVVPGKPAESLLLQSAAHSDADLEPMPPIGNKVNAPNLTSQQLGLLSLWIQQGAKGEVKGSGPLAWRTVAPTVQPILAVAVAPDGSIAGAGRGVGIDLFDLKTNKPIGPISDPSLKAAGGRQPAHLNLVQCLAFSPDGMTLASGGYREVKLWKRQSDSEPGEWKLEKTIGTGDRESPLVDRVLALDFSPDGKTLAIASGQPSRSGQVAIADVASGKIEKSLDEIHSDSVQALQFSSDGRQLVTGSADKFVRLLEMPSGKVLRSFEGHTHHVLGVAISKDGKTIVSAGGDNLLRFWEAETGERKKASPTFEKEATSVSFTGADVVACTGDGKVETFKDTGAKSKSFAGAKDFMHAAAASEDGKLIVAGGQDGVLRVWSSDGKSVATFE